MLFHRLAQPLRDAQLQPPPGLQPSVQRARLRLEVAVARESVERHVQLLVLAVVVIAVAELHRALAAVGQHLQLPQVLGRRAPRRETAAQVLELGHDLEHLHDLQRIGHAHEHAPVRAVIDQSRRDEQPQGLANRRAGHPEPLGQTALVETCAAGELAEQDGPLELFSDVFGRSRVHPVRRSGDLGPRVRRRLFDAAGLHSIASGLYTKRQRHRRRTRPQGVRPCLSTSPR